jgi:hypothetical protein
MDPLLLSIGHADFVDDADRRVELSDELRTTYNNNNSSSGGVPLGNTATD